ncbi:hypothetical protein BGZ67_001335 [Mortierella alpina]|nr:hypothetical protein BGZ67_001335 [Mortierella alpina]
MPLYYKYVQRDVRQKDSRWEAESLLPIHDVLRNYRKSSVLASKRFSLALKIMTLVLLILVVVGFYYLWGRDNHCTDSKMWIVKAWYIALLVVAIIVTAIMIAAMVRAAKDKKLLRASNAKSSAIEMDATDQGSKSAIVPTKLPSPSFDTATGRPPAYPESPVTRAACTSEGKDTPEASKEKSAYLTAQAEQVEQAEQQQRQQMHGSHSQAGYGASGTGAYC